MSNADGIWERMVTKGDIGLHYISIFQYQHDHSHDRGEGCRRTAKGGIFYNFLVVISLTWNWEFLYKKILSGSKYYGLASELCTYFKFGDNILIPCPGLKLGWC